MMKVTSNMHLSRIILNNNMPLKYNSMIMEDDALLYLVNRLAKMNGLYR